VILIERQPIGGLVHVEQLLYQAFRNKAILCSPNTIHRHFHMAYKDYDKRKEQSVELARPYLEYLPFWEECQDRRHDVSDALLMLLWWVKMRQLEHEQKILKEQREQEFQQCKQMPMEEYFDRFRYHPSPGSKLDKQ